MLVDNVAGYGGGQCVRDYFIVQFDGMLKLTLQTIMQRDTENQS